MMKENIDQDLLIKGLQALYKIDKFKDNERSNMKVFLTKSLKYLSKEINLSAGQIFFKNPFENHYSEGARINLTDKVASNFKEMINSCYKRKSSIQKIYKYYVQCIMLDGEILGFICCYKETGISENDIYLINAVSTQIDSGIRAITDFQILQHKKQINELMLDIDKYRDENPQSMENFLKPVMQKLKECLKLINGVAFVLDEIYDSYYPACILDESKFSEENRLSKVVQGFLNNELIEFTENNIIVKSLKMADKQIAIIGIEGKQAFRNNDKELFDCACNQIDSGIAAILNYQMLLKKSKVIDALYAIDNIRDKFSNQFETMLKKICDSLNEILESETAFIVLNQKEEYFLKAISGKNEDYNNIITSLAKETISKGELQILKNVNAKIKAGLVLPLILKENVIGVFGVFNPLEKTYYNKYDMELLTAVGSQADTAIFESVEKQKIRNVFKRYVPEVIINEMLEKEDDFFQGKKKNMSVLFADIRGFTTFSENNDDPELIMDTINKYFETMTEVIFSYKGTLDKFVGDEVMALFGTPLNMPDNPLIAIRTAVDMQKEWAKLISGWANEERQNLKVGIGMNYGEMIAGNVGCEKMTDYTVLGTTVNIASRLCGVALGGQIVITEDMKMQVENYCSENNIKFEYDFKELAPVPLKGVIRPIAIYEVIY